MFKKKNNNEPTEVTKLARSGNPSKRAKVEKEVRAEQTRRRNKERFLQVTGLVVVGVLGATPLVGAFGSSF